MKENAGKSPRPLYHCPGMLTGHNSGMTATNAMTTAAMAGTNPTNPTATNVADCDDDGGDEPNSDERSGLRRTWQVNSEHGRFTTSTAGP